MPSNNGKIVVGYLAGRYPGRIGWLLSTDGGWRNPYSWLPYAVDNGAYPAYTNNRPWNESAFWVRLSQCHAIEQQPLWVVVPDVVTNRKATLEMWDRYAPHVRKLGFRTAFACQDGMTPADIPDDADVAFVGGSFKWKWANLERFCKAHPRVHCARVNSKRLLWLAHIAGAESCDGTGWFRGDKRQLNGLFEYLAESSQQHSKFALRVRQWLLQNAGR